MLFYYEGRWREVSTLKIKDKKKEWEANTQEELDLVIDVEYLRNVVKQKDIYLKRLENKIDELFLALDEMGKELENKSVDLEKSVQRLEEMWRYVNRQDEKNDTIKRILEGGRSL